MLSMLALLGTFLLMPLVAQAQKYTVTFEQVKHCTITASYGYGASKTEVNSGDQVTRMTYLSIQATPEEGYMVTHYIINGQSQENKGTPVRISVKEDLTISAQVIQVRPCTVTITQPEHGTLKVTSVGREVQSGNQINSGSRLTLELTPEAGYEIEYWIINGKKSLPNEGADLRNKTFLSLMDDITITAQLKVEGTKTMVPVTIVNPEFATIKAYKGRYTSSPELQEGEKVEVGSDLALKITINDDFHALDHWLINNDRVEKDEGYFSSEKQLKVVEAMTISAVLKEAGYVITYNQPEEGGTLTVKEGFGFSAKEVASGSRVKEGAKLNISATVQNGYKLKHFLINNKVKMPDSPMYPSITEVANSDMTIEAVFEKLPACIVTITPFEHGTLKATYGDYSNPTTVANGDEVPMNTRLSLEATVDPDYEFKHFFIDGVETASSYHYSNVYTLNITVLKSVSIAVVAEKKPTTKVTIEPFEHGELIVKYGPSSKRIKVASGDEVPQGTMLDVDAWFDDGYGLDHFLVNGEPKPSDDTEYDYIELTVGNTPLKLSAVAKKTHGLIVMVQPDAAQGAMTAHYTDNGQQKDLRDSTWVALQTPVTFVVTPKEGYEMDHWMVDDARQDLDASKPNELTLTVTADLKVEPVLKAKAAPQPTTYTVTLTQPAATQGAMTAHYTNDDTKAVTDGMSVEKDTQVTFVVVPAEGYEMDHWMVDDQTKPLESADPNQLTLIVTADLKVEPVLKAKVVTYTVTLTQPDAAQGTMTAHYTNDAAKEVTTGMSVEKDTQVTFVVVPAEGYEMASWKVDDQPKALESADPNQLTLTVTDNLKVEPVLKAKAAPQPTEFKVTMVNPASTQGTMMAHYTNDAAKAVTDGMSVAKDTQVTFVVVPAEGYEMDSWKVDGQPKALDGTKPNELTLTVTDNLKVEPVLKAKVVTYTVTMTQPAATQGTMTAHYTNDATKEVTTGASVAKDTQVTFVVTPAEGYKMASWKVDGQTKALESADPNQLTLTVTADLKVEPVLKETAPLVKHTVTLGELPDEKGSFYALYGSEGTIVRNGQMLPEGTEVSFQVDAAEGYELDYWMVDDVKSEDTSNPLVITLSKDIKVVPVMKKTGAPAEFTVTLGEWSNTKGFFYAFYGEDMTAIQSGASLPAGTEVSFQVDAAEGYELDYWMVDDVKSDDTRNPLVITLSKDIKVVPVMKEKAAPQPTDARITMVQPEHGKMTASYYDDEEYDTFDVIDGGRVNLGVNVTFVVTPNEGYEMDYWMVDDERQELDTETPNETIITVTGDLKVEPVLKAKAAPQPTKFTVTMIQPKEGQGTMTAYYYNKTGDKTALTSGNTVAEGTYVTFEVTPAEGYEMDHWMIDDQPVEGTSNTKGITVEGNLKVEPVLKAKATPQPTTGKITIIKPKAEEGTMSVYTFDGYGDFVFIKDGQSVKIGTDLTFKVTPKEGYEMDYWMVNDERQELSTSTPNQKTITVTGNLKVQPVLKAKAAPQPVEYTITMILPNSKEGTMVAYTYDSDGNVKTVVSGMTVKSGTKVTFAVGLKEGYEMDYWMVNDQREELEGGDYPNKKTITVTGDLKVEPILKAKAAPQPKTVLVKISYEGTGAYLETTYLEPGGSGNPLKIFGDKDIPVGSVVTVRLKSFMAGDYQVVYTNNGNAVPAETLSEDGLVYTFTANEDAHVHGVISEKPAPAVDYTITFEAGEGGKVTATVDMEPIESGAKIAAGTQIKILAEPNENYEIDQWLVNGKPVANTGLNFYYLKLMKDTHVKVTFRSTLPPAEYAVVVEPVLPSAKAGTVQLFKKDGSLVASGKTVVTGTEMYVEVKPADKYELETLQVNNTTIKAGDEKLVNLAGGGFKYAFTVTEATTIKATFKLINAIEQLTESQIAVYVTNGGTRLEVAGAAEGAEVRLYDYTGQLLLTSTEHALDISALPAGGYIVLVGNYTTRIVK